MNAATQGGVRREKTALLIIDVQNAMFAFPKYPPYRGEELLQNIAALLARARETGTPAVFVRHNEAEGPFRKDAPTREIHPAIAPLPGEPVVDKEHPDSFQGTDLSETLEGLGVGRLIICGMQTDFCVDTTVRRAFSLGYESILVGDAHSTFSNPALPAEKIVAHHNHVLRSFAKVTDTQEAINEMRDSCGNS